MKERFRKAWRYYRIRLVNMIGNRRAIVVMLLLFIIFWEYGKDIRMMSKMTGVDVSQHFFSFFMSDYVVATGLMKVLILLVYVVVICNVSKMENEKYYYVIRTGRKAWIIGDIMFIGFVSLIFCVIIYLYSILCFFPNLEFQMSWGKIIGTLAYTDASIQYGSLFVIPARMIELYDPIMATLLSTLMLFLGCMFLGLMIYTANIISKTSILGIVMASFFILLSPIIVYLRLPELYWFSPMSWISVGNLYPIRDIEYPSAVFAVTMLLAIIIGFMIALNICSKKIEVRGDDNG